MYESTIAPLAFTDEELRQLAPLAFTGEELHVTSIREK